MRQHGEPITILLAEDDEDDCEVVSGALLDARLVNDLRIVGDGQELMDYLRRQGAYSDPAIDAPRPGVILLDLNMPRKDGREALTEIKSDPDLRKIPVIVLTTSQDEADVVRSYDLGVNSFITKPVSFHGLVEALEIWRQYWFEFVELPPGPGHSLSR